MLQLVLAHVLPTPIVCEAFKEILDLVDLSLQARRGGPLKLPERTLMLLLGASDCDVSLYLLTKRSSEPALWSHLEAQHALTTNYRPKLSTQNSLNFKRFATVGHVT